jgi:hypothetical protein
MRSLPFISLLAALAVAACGAPASSNDGSSGPGAEPVQADAARDGVSVTLAVDRDRVAAGGDMTATVWVRNNGVNAVTWQGGGCELQGQFSVTPDKPLPAPPIGHVWDGDKNLLKQFALPDAYAARWPLPPEFAHRDDVAFGCTADLGYNQLQAGEETHATVVWVAATVGGSPLPAGDYLVAVDFPFVGREIGDPLLGKGIGDVKPISARLTVTVEDHPEMPPAIDAMDAILADPAFTAWLRDHASRTWNSTAIRWLDGAWVVQIRYEPGRLMSARRDPGSGGVTLAESAQP